MAAYYEILFGLSVLLTLGYIIIWHKHFDVHISLIFAFIPVANLGYVMMAHAMNLEAALVAVKVTYIGGCFLSLFITQSIFGLCKIELKRWMHAVLMLMSLGSFALVFTDLLQDSRVRFLQGHGPPHENIRLGPHAHIFCYLLLCGHQPDCNDIQPRKKE